MSQTQVLDDLLEPSLRVLHANLFIVGSHPRIDLRVIDSTLLTNLSRQEVILRDLLLPSKLLPAVSSRAGVAPAEVQRLSRRTVTTVTQRLNCHKPASGRLN
jgi:hypothetical protein